MRDASGHFTQHVQTIGVGELFEMFARGALSRALLRNIPDESDKLAFRMHRDFTDREVDREYCAVLASRASLQPRSDYPRDTCFEIIAAIALMLGRVRVRHEHADILSGDFEEAITEHLLGRAVERFDPAGSVYRNHRLDSGFDDGFGERAGIGECPFSGLASSDIRDQAFETGVIVGRPLAALSPFPYPALRARARRDPVFEFVGGVGSDRNLRPGPDPIAILRVDNVAPQDFAVLQFRAGISTQFKTAIAREFDRPARFVQDLVQHPGNTAEQRCVCRFA